MDKLIQNSIVVKKSTIHGYGVFATHAIEKDTVIETCYTLIANKPDPALHNYYFGYKNKCLILLGYGFIYNHSSSPNARYFFDEDKKIMTIAALKNIDKNEEIFVSYGEQWFSCRNAAYKKSSWFKKIFRYLKGFPQRAFIVLCVLFVFTHLETVSTVSKPAQKILETLAKTTQQAINA